MSILCGFRHHPKSGYFHIQNSRANFAKCRITRFFSFNIIIFDGAWCHTKFPFNILIFGCFSDFELYLSWKSGAIGKLVVPCDIQMISVE